MQFYKETLSQTIVQRKKNFQKKFLLNVFFFYEREPLVVNSCWGVELALIAVAAVNMFVLIRREKPQVFENSFVSSHYQEKK